MTSILVYDTEAKEIERLADEHNTTVAEIVYAMTECFSDNDGEGYLE